MNNTEFHRPFISSLMIIAGVTIVLLASTRFLLLNYSISHQKASSFTSASLEK
jgi:hypothetical protein